MLGIRLSAEAEDRLARHASGAGRPKSVIARDWILERLEREEVDGLIRNAAQLHATGHGEGSRALVEAATELWMHALDAEDGGYDWGAEGPPSFE